MLFNTKTWYATSVFGRLSSFYVYSTSTTVMDHSPQRRREIKLPIVNIMYSWSWHSSALSVWNMTFPNRVTKYNWWLDLVYKGENPLGHHDPHYGELGHQVSRCVIIK